MPQPSVTEILAIIRRYAEAFADGRIDAKAVPSMTDDQLAEFDTQIYTRLLEAQAEAEQLAAEPK
jgi:hypothetical protein